MMNKKKIYTHRAFIRPSILEGVARIVDVNNQLQRYKPSKATLYVRVDEQAIYSDWNAIGGDMRYAISTFERKNRVTIQDGKVVKR